MPPPPSRVRRSSSLMPVTVVYERIPTDISLPVDLPLIEVVPALAERLEGLGEEASAYGMCLTTQAGRVLDDCLSLADQRVGAGDVLTLDLRSMEAEHRYDDLTEAVAAAVERQQIAWDPKDTLTLSVGATCLLFTAGGALLLRQGPGGWVTPACAAVAAVLLILAALAIKQMKEKGAWALVITAAILAGVTLHTGIQGPPTGLRMAAAGTVGASLLGACIPVLDRDRPLLAGPLLVCVAMMVTGLGTHTLGHQLASVLALVSATAAGVSLLTPWLALASVPVTISLPDQPEGYHRAEDEGPIKAALTSRILNMHGLVLSVRIACSMIVLASVPALASVGYDGVALVAAIAVAAMLSTRAVRSRADVTAGVVGGMLILAALVLVIVLKRTDVVMPMVVLVGVVGVVVLLLNVLGPNYRPRLARLTDAIEILVLLSIAPLAALVIGVL